jgi:NADH-quinone oxidoreductase subunit H
VDVFLDILRGLVAVVIAYAFVFVSALVNILFERRTLAFMQDRLGPNRTGPQGILQSVADSFKMLGKEDFAPAAVDKRLFTLAPIMVMIGAVAVQLVIPYTKGWTGQDLNVGIIYVVAVTSFTVLAILIGGWASHNKYSLVGALRSAAQMVSYEVPMILALLVVAAATGSLSLNDVVSAQDGYRWFVFVMPTTFFIFFIASIAELNRGPFDLPESESELVAGYGTEYSGMRFGMFFLNEYAGMTIMSMVTVTLFFGGWAGPGEDLLVLWGVSVIPFVWFMIKTYVLVFALVWIRLSVPRLQVNELMAFAWKFLIPLGLANILASAAIILWAPQWKWVMAGFSWVVLIAIVGLFDPLLRRRLRRKRAQAPSVTRGTA